MQYNYLKISALVFGVTPFLGLILNTAGQVLLARVISQFGVLFLVYGVYSYATINEGYLKNEGMKIAALFLVFWIFNIVGVLIDSLFPLEIPESASAEKKQALASLAVFTGMLAVLFYTIFLYTAIKFTGWFEQVALQVNIRGTTAMKWLGVVYTIAATSIFMGKTLLYSLVMAETELETADVSSILVGGLVLSGAGSLLILGGFSLQIVTGLILYSRLSGAKTKKIYTYKLSS
ncbi:MAG: hypothetical protein ACFFD4_14115 [Candidatus Odinarchaeota archaeon]